MTTEIKSDLATIHRALRAISGWSDSGEPMVSILDRILNTVLDEQFDGAIIPVLVKGEQQSIVYYACAISDLEWRKLQPLLLAAIGVTLTDFDGYAPQFNPVSEVEKIIASVGFKRIAAFGSRGDRNLGRQVAENLDRLITNVKRKPNSEPEFRSTTSQLLAEFDLCLTYGKYERARSIISELSGSMRLDAVNVWFLKTRFHAHFDESREIVKSDYFNSLVNVRKPTRITLDLIEAIYRHDLYQYEKTNDPEAAIEAYRELRTEYGDLFKMNPDPETPSIGKALLINELASATQDGIRINFLREKSESWKSPDRAFFDSLFDTLGQPAAEDKTPSQYDVISKAREALLWVAAQTSDQNRVQWDAAFDALSEEQRHELLSDQKYADLYEEITSDDQQAKPPTSWAELFEQAPELGPLEIRGIASNLASSVDLNVALKTRAQINEFVAMLVDVGDVENILPAIPNIVNWLKNDEQWPNAGFIKIYQQISFVLAFANTVEDSILDAVADLVIAAVNLGMEGTDYRDLLGALSEMATNHARAKQIDWLLDMIEGLLAAPCPESSARQQFIDISVQKFNDHMSRVNADQFELMKEILGSVDMDGALRELPAGDRASTDTKTKVTPWQGSVAIYSLNESAAARAQSILEKRLPNSNIRINHDHVNTPGLENLAATSDLFVICSGQAKHAATNAIMSVRRARGATTLYASGSSSIINVVAEYTSHNLA